MSFSLKSRLRTGPDGPDLFKRLANLYHVCTGLCSCKFLFHNIIEYLTYLIYH